MRTQKGKSIEICKLCQHFQESSEARTLLLCKQARERQTRWSWEGLKSPNYTQLQRKNV